MSLGKSSGRWRRGWCASVLTTLSSNRVLKALLPTLCLALVLVYGLADKLRNFVASVFIPQYHFPYAVALCFAQVLVSISALTLLHVLNVVPLRRYSRSLGEKMLVPSICSSIHAVLAMWAKANSSDIGLFPLLLPLLPLATLGFSLSQKLASSPSLHISAPISILGGTSFVVSASQGLSGVGLLEYMYAPLALILHSLSLTFLAKASEAERRRRPPEAQASIFDIYYTQLVNQSCVLGLLWLLHPQSPWLVLSHSNWQSLLFHGYLLAILLLGTLLDLLVGVSALCVSPFAAALLHSARQLAQPLLQLL
ncbi:uncharacterized protein si:ch211-248a14.8 isoform X2 [Pseudoliparis swirei]|uniref:uncharacterized protein si:ch211-248a14.8 isoform X2 n=1 Tax=Pseudoliparis swirei TaxID=2059687 RepID=UPI0024BDBD6B|nr:uncharacterized protein si:ch211-248a14.8 isoform X2 [Pseudoliparis swirei]